MKSDGLVFITMIAHNYGIIFKQTLNKYGKFSWANFDIIFASLMK